MSKVEIVMSEEVKKAFDDVTTRLETLNKEILCPENPDSLKNRLDRHLQEEEGEKNAQKEAMDTRCGKYPVSPHVEQGGHITKPSEYADIPEDSFADPCNFKYPMDEAHVMAAWAYVSKPENQSKGGYSDEEWTWIKSRIKKKMESAGHEVEEGERGELFIKVKPGSDLLSPSLATLGIRLQQEPEVDEHGCKVGKEKYDEGEAKCVPLTDEERAEHLKTTSKRQAQGLTIEEIKGKIAELTQQKAELEQKLYPSPTVAKEEVTDIRAKLDALNAEIDGYGEALAAKIAEGGGERQETASFDKTGEQGEVSPGDAKVAAQVMRRER